MLSPLDPRCPVDNEMLLYTDTRYVKVVLGLGVKGLHIKHLTKIDYFAGWSFSIVHQLCKYILYCDMTIVYLS